jgi:hypothetical protein
MKKTVILASVVLLAAAAGVIRAAGTVGERSSLKGVQPMRPSVGKLPLEASTAGVDAKRLRAVIEERLKAQGVPVNTNGVNDLALTLSTSPGRDGFHAVHLRLECTQLVALFHEFIRDPESRTLAPTWSASWIGILKPDEMKQVEGELAKLVDQFAADWKIGNLGRSR